LEKPCFGVCEVREKTLKKWASTHKEGEKEVSRVERELDEYAVRLVQVRLDGRGRVLIPAKMRRGFVDWRERDVIEVELLDPTTIRLRNRSLQERRIRGEERGGEYRCLKS